MRRAGGGDAGQNGGFFHDKGFLELRICGYLSFAEAWQSLLKICHNFTRLIRRDHDNMMCGLYPMRAGASTLTIAVLIHAGSKRAA
jgi:hypothetical protein